MQTIFESKFKKTSFDSAKALMINTWTDAEMTDDDFKTEILSWAELVEKYKPSKMIADTTKYNYLNTPESQTWTGTVIFPRLISAGMKKFAIIIPTDILKQMALEQTMDEEKSGTLATSYFDSISKAEQWAMI